MEFSNTIVRGRLLRRYKRFLADIELSSGEVVVAHCANPGSMLGLIEEGGEGGEGGEVWLLPNMNPAAKLDWRWEVIIVNGVAVGINTGRANDLVMEALGLGGEGVIEELSCYGDDILREVKVGDGSRLDFLLGSRGEGGEGGEGCYVEVKSVTLSRVSGLAEFPDSETKRGLKHLGVLGDLARAGNRAILLYIVQRGDCDEVMVAGDIDGKYLVGLREAMDLGVEVLAYGCCVGEGGIFIDRGLKFRNT